MADSSGDRRMACALGALTVLLGLAFFNPFMGGWDSVVYMTAILNGEPSPLMLGRPYFIGYNILLWEAASAIGVPEAQAYQVVKGGVVVLSGVASAFLFLFFRRLVNYRAAVWGALLLACSPVVAELSGAIMTEMPMLAAVFWGLWLYQRGVEERRLASLVGGCVLLGIAAGMREAAVFVAPYLVAAPILAGWRGREWRGAALGWTAGSAVFLAGPAYLWVTSAQYSAGLSEWSHHMAESRDRYPTSYGSNFPIWFAWIKATLPITAFLAPWGFWRLWHRRGERPFAAAYAAICVVELLLLMGYQDLLYGPRFLLIAMPGLALSVGVAIDSLRERVAYRPLAVTFTLVCALSLSYAYWVAFLQGYGRTHAIAREYDSRLSAVPARATFVVGHMSPYLRYYSRTGDSAVWETIAAGWGWPGENLAAEIDRRLDAGVPVFVDEEPALWAGFRTRREFDDWWAIRDRYELMRVDGTLLRIERGRHDRAAR